MHLLSAEIALRGCTIDNLGASQHVKVEQSIARSMLAAALFALLDEDGPIAIQLRGQADGDRHASLALIWMPLASPAMPPMDRPDHVVSWSDVQAIAVQEGVAVRCLPNRFDMQLATVE
jgi:hypothetical protein